MSLIVHTIVPDGIVACSDTRTTFKENGKTRYDDTCEKTIPFPNRVVISHCGDNKIRNDLTVTQFLYDI